MRRSNSGKHGGRPMARVFQAFAANLYNVFLTEGGFPDESPIER
jgi:hypothetical protein